MKFGTDRNCSCVGIIDLTMTVMDILLLLKIFNQILEFVKGKGQAA